jgi:hypothetical protein
MLRLTWPKPIEWIYIAGGLSLSVIYLWFLDDAFVYFRYVDNFLFLNIGLVYNAGEYVEGYSSPLWVLLLIVLRATGASYLVIIIIVAVLAFLTFSLLTVAVNRALSPPGVVINFPLAFLSFNYGVLSYFTSGVETPFVQVAALVFAAYAIAPRSRALQAAVGCSPLLRHELILPLIVSIAWGWVRTRKPPLYSIVSFALSCAGWCFFRVVYYADILPNTFYLKDTWMISQGLRFLHDTMGPYQVYPILIVGVGLIINLRRKRAELHLPIRGIMLFMAVLVVLYVVKIGGGPRHFRYLAFPFCLVITASAGLIEYAFLAVVPKMRSLWAPVSGIALALFSFSLYPRQIAHHPALDFEHNDHNQVELINDAFAHRRHPGLNHEKWSRIADPAKMKAYRERHSPFEYKSVKVTGWCVGGYRNFNKRVVHPAGLTDAILARVDTPAERPAHKPGLHRLAHDIAAILREYPKPHPGMYRDAVERGLAPQWIESNLGSIEIIERKVYNRHNLWENLNLALSFPGRISPGENPEPAR